MANPTPYERTYSFTDYQASNPSAPLPGLQVDNELENVETSLGEAIDAIADVRRSDGALKNGIVTVDSLDATVAAGVGAGALASAEAAAASADAASDSAVAAAASATAASGSATSASGYASDALTSRNEASGFSDDSAAAASLSATARDFANKWATEAEDVDVNDGVNPVGKSAFHWAQVALTAAAGSIADGSVTTAKLVDGVLSADTTGRAKMADGFVTSAKIADGTIATADLADGSVTSAKIADGTIATGDIADSAITSAKIADGTIATGDLADGILAADTTGRAKMADGFVTFVKLDSKAVQLRNSGAIALSGTSVELTGIPADVQRVFLDLDATLSSGSAGYRIELGDASGFPASGYSGAISILQSSIAAASMPSTHLQINGATGTSLNGLVILTKQTGDVWKVTGAVQYLAAGNVLFNAKVSGLVSALTRLRISTGSAATLGGSAKIWWEF